MIKIALDNVMQARNENFWDFTNNVLYDLCKKNPNHNDVEVIIAKVLLIGRSYSAAIERSPHIKKLRASFYVNEVGPKIKNSKIDEWLAEARKARAGTECGLNTLVNVHGKLTELFYEISKKRNRSLASKYLHFHIPKLFYIYDSRARDIIGRIELPKTNKSNIEDGGDSQYRLFAQKCGKLQEICKNDFGAKLTPRQIDNLLLTLHRKNKQKAR